MSNLRISLFGKFQVEFHGKPLSNGFDSRKVQELFSYLLAYRNRSHPRETLADLLWGDNSSVQARKYLRQALWQLQSALKSESEENSREVLIVDTEWVSINQDADFWLDLRVFEDAYANVQGKPGNELPSQHARALREAVQLYTDGLLAGWYHDWCIFERERFQNMYLAMLNKLMIYSESCEEYETALLYGQRILQCDRAHERSHRQIMRLHYLAGDRTSALRQYERCVEALQEELGVEPARSTIKLYEQIRTDELQEPLLSNPRLNVETASPTMAEASPNLESLEALLAQFNNQMHYYMKALEPASSNRT